MVGGHGEYGFFAVVAGPEFWFQVAGHYYAGAFSDGGGGVFCDPAEAGDGHPDGGAVNPLVAGFCRSDQAMENLQ